MTETVIIAIIALIGTIVSGVISAVMANRITVYRIDALTREVERHNQVIERTYRLEQRVDDMDGRLNRVENNR
ncbi:MAG: hypothetical protein J6S67_23660 [Methanobrevibacter sp.]|nr:hypothetical protein [Methanobrevibacter sp.]